jgi:hypothetical protein
MVPKTTNPDEHLLPAKHSNGDLFICDVADAALKDLIPQMEHPFFSLSKKPDTAIRRYEHNGNWLEIVPSVKGLATIYDKDILIYCISQIMEKLKREEPALFRRKLSSRRERSGRICLHASEQTLPGCIRPPGPLQCLFRRSLRRSSRSRRILSSVASTSSQ